MQSKREAVEAMLHHVRSGTTDQADHVMLVEANGYTDAEGWRREMATIFHRLPVLAGLSVELPNPGDFKAVDYCGKPLLITRLNDGSVRAMLNVCTHRGMLVAAEGTGNCKRFSCPYHGWTFANDGRLIAVADKSKFGEVDASELGLKQLPVYERAGLIFVVLQPGTSVDFEAYFGAALDDIASLDLANAHFCGTREILGANWKVAYDGYLEGYHFAAAHPETIHPRTFSNIMQFDACGPHIRIGFPQRSILEALDGVDAAELGQKENEGYDFVRTLFPNVSIFAAPELIQISQIIPGPQPNRNRTVMYFVSREPPATEQTARALDEMVEFLREVVDREDFGVGLKVQRGLESGAIDHVRFGRNERGNQYFHRWVEYYMTDDPGREAPVL